ncbi:hypothetical protein OE88DRAFT_1135285 [Heliocybe sulcata]|uniref:Uncharacterized protein n=1 Tax=Heliocybe sulcata TaxID=5364 RepID=A0A5C3NBY2_9AGAM|nr:hypothetical protein OE88DRAFT_1135285 [Heliocybe sulcata]
MTCMPPYWLKLLLSTNARRERRKDSPKSRPHDPQLLLTNTLSKHRSMDTPCSTPGTASMASTPSPSNHLSLPLATLVAPDATHKDGDARSCAYNLCRGPNMTRSLTPGVHEEAGRHAAQAACEMKCRCRKQTCLNKSARQSPGQGDWQRG